MVGCGRRCAHNGACTAARRGQSCIPARYFVCPEPHELGNGRFCVGCRSVLSPLWKALHQAEVPSLMTAHHLLGRRGRSACAQRAAAMSSTPVAERSNEVERQVSDTPNSPYRPTTAGRVERRSAAAAGLVRSLAIALYGHRKKNAVDRDRRRNKRKSSFHNVELDTSS